MNNINVTKITIAYPNGTNESPTYTFNFTSNSINLVVNTPVPGSSSVVMAIDSINTPPYETTSTIIMVTSSTAYGNVDTYQSCVIQNTPVYVIYGNFSSTGPINSFISSPNSTSINFQNIKITLGDRFTTDLNFNGSTFSDSNISLYNVNETVTCTKTTICVISGSKAESSANQSYVMRFTRALKLPSSSEPTYVNITFSNSGSSYLKIALFVKANPGSLTGVSLVTSPTTVGSISNGTFTFTISSNPLGTPFGIYVKVPTGIKIESNASCSSSMSEVNTPVTSIVDT